jgi:hypothetical protein
MLKIDEVDIGHILEVDKTMANMSMRFMTNMDDQYTNKSDNKEDSKDDVEDIHPGDKLVNYFDNGNNYNNDDDYDDDEDDDDNNRAWVMMAMHTVMLIKEGDSLLQAYYLEVIIEGKYFNFRIVSIYKLICHN